MKRRGLWAWLAVLALLVGTLTAVQRFGAAGQVAEPAVRRRLPDRVGEWQGEPLLFCQNEACQRSFPERALAEPGVCPACGARLSTISLAEQRILPADTVILRRRYEDPRGRWFVVSMVVSGEQRASIHRPQWCLPAQGYTITASRLLRFGPSAGREAMLLDLQRPAHAGANSRDRVQETMAYWFVGGAGQHTPYHWRRHMLAAIDSVLFGRTQRWAYLSVTTPRRPDVDSHLAALQRFLPALMDGLQPGG